MLKNIFKTVEMWKTHYYPYIPTLLASTFYKKKCGKCGKNQFYAVFWNNLPHFSTSQLWQLCDLNTLLPHCCIFMSQCVIYATPINL